MLCAVQWPRESTRASLSKPSLPPTAGISHHLPAPQMHGRELRAEELQQAGNDSVEHRLHVGRRAGDDLQDLGARGLAQQRFLSLFDEV